MKTIEININEVSEITGISENNIYKNIKKYAPKLEQYGITFDGKGKKRKFYQVQQDIISNEQIAYDTFEQIVYNAWGFDRRVEVDKLLHFMSLILVTQTVEGHNGILSNEEIAKIVDVDKETIRKYKKKLVSNEVVMPTHLSRVVTYASLMETEMQTITNELIPFRTNQFNSVDQERTLDNFQYSIKLIPGEIIKQKAQNKVVVDNKLFESYLNACRTIANTKNLRNKYEYEQVENLIHDNKLEFNVTETHKYYAFQDFKRELGIDKLYQVHKTEYTPRFMNEIIPLDILVKSFRYKFSDSLLNDKLKQYDMEYVETDIADLHEQGLKEVIPF